MVEGGRGRWSATRSRASLRAGPDAAGRARRRRSASDGDDARPASRRPSTQSRAQFARYKEDVKERGKPFYPYAMFHDTVMSLVVVVGHRRARDDLEVDVVGAASRRHCTRACSARSTRRRPTRARRASCRGRTGTSTSSSISSGSSSGRTSVFLGTVGVPTIALILLIALPFYDLRRERRLLAAAGRRWSARCSSILSMAILTWKGATAQGGARLRGDRRRAALGQGREAAAEGRARGEALRGRRLHGLPHVSRRGLVEPRRARPHGDRHAEPRHRLPGQPPEVPVVRESRLADAEIRVARATSACTSWPSSSKHPRASR